MPDAAIFVPFRYIVHLFDGDDRGASLCGGAFSEVSGLEAMMAPKTFTEGGRHWGDVHRAGQTTFATVVLKRGVTDVADLWNWFERLAGRGHHHLRGRARIEVLDRIDGEPRLVFVLERAMPVKFKGPDLSATGEQVAIEELHLVHEGLTVERPGAGSGLGSGVTGESAA